MTITVKGDEVRRVLRNVLPFAAQDDSRPQLRGVRAGGHVRRDHHAAPDPRGRAGIRHATEDREGCGGRRMTRSTCRECGRAWSSGWGAQSKSDPERCRDCYRNYFSFFWRNAHPPKGTPPKSGAGASA